MQAVPPVMVILLLVGIAAAVALAQRAPSAVTAEIRLSADMAEAARRLVSALTPAQRARTMFPLAADERLRWHYVSQPRPGLAFKELSDAQRALAFGLLSTALSRRGFVKASSIMALDQVLRQRENSPVRDPGPTSCPCSASRRPRRRGASGSRAITCRSAARCGTLHVGQPSVITSFTST